MKKPAVVTAVRPAGANEFGEHQVVRVEGGGKCYRTKPCPNCPWREDAVGEFPPEAFRISAPTSYDMAMETFACHEAGAKKPATCAGFLLSGARHNFNVRMMAMRGEIDFSRISDGGVALFPSYKAMAVANGVDPDDPVLAQSRED